MTTDLDDIDFERLIGDRDIDVCKLIEEMNKQGIAEALYFHARDVIKGRWPEAETHIMKDPCWVYRYASKIIGGRWLEAEPYIKKDSYWAGCYSFRFGVKL